MAEEPQVTRDPLGFKHRGTIKAEVIANLARRSMRWNKKFPKISQITHKRFTRSFKRFIRKGVPHDLRPKVWCLAAQRQVRLHNRRRKAADRIDIPDGARILREGRFELSDDVSTQIELDLPRTFPEHHEFQENTETLKSLDRVLRAFAHLHPNIGYCQGMAFIAGVLLLTTKSEEEALYLLQCIILVYMPDYFTAKMRVQNDLQLLTTTINTQRRYANIASSLAAAGADVSIFAVKWLMSLFIDTLPTDQLLITWDLFFLNGRKTLLQTALAVLEGNTSAIQRTKDLTELVGVLREQPLTSQLPPQPFGRLISAHRRSLPARLQ